MFHIGTHILARERMNGAFLVRMISSSGFLQLIVNGGRDTGDFLSQMIVYSKFPSFLPMNALTFSSFWPLSTLSFICEVLHNLRLTHWAIVFSKGISQQGDSTSCPICSNFYLFCVFRVPADGRIQNAGYVNISSVPRTSAFAQVGSQCLCSLGSD